jgi:hypothetical protein
VLIHEAPASGSRTLACCASVTLQAPPLEVASRV